MFWQQNKTSQKIKIHKPSAVTIKQRVRNEKQWDIFD
jgi:hypothetical protein